MEGVEAGVGFKVRTCEDAIGGGYVFNRGFKN